MAESQHTIIRVLGQQYALRPLRATANKLSVAFSDGLGQQVAGESGLASEPLERIPLFR